jgi:hypothetical protein
MSQYEEPRPSKNKKKRDRRKAKKGPPRARLSLIHDTHAGRDLNFFVFCYRYYRIFWTAVDAVAVTALLPFTIGDIQRNFSAVVADCHPGCMLASPALLPGAATDGELSESGLPVTYPAWCLGAEVLQDEEEEIEYPDMAIDPDDGVLSILNPSETARTYFVTVGEVAQVLTASGEDLLGGRAYVNLAHSSFIL